MSFMSITDIAAAEGVSKQAISKRVQKFADRVPTRKQGRELLVDVERFRELTGQDVDPAQALRNRSVNPNAARGGGELPLEAPRTKPHQEMSAGARGQEAFSVYRAQREKSEAKLAEMAVEEKLGQLIRTRDAEEAMVKLATALLRHIDGMPAKSTDPVQRAALKEVARELRVTLHNEMKLMADQAEEAA